MRAMLTATVWTYSNETTFSYQNNKPSANMAVKGSVSDTMDKSMGIVIGKALKWLNQSKFWNYQMWPYPQLGCARSVFFSNRIWIIPETGIFLIWYIPDTDKSVFLLQRLKNRY